ncbi:MAG: DUF4249 family protein [Bacteroidetes bacterium]|nr:DUF4249 family protein [Bacteroidota bacterium]
MVLFCLGCETIVEVDPPEYDSEPVVTSFFSPDSIWSVTMHRSLGITVKRDATREYISDASVRIMDGSNMVDILSYQGNGRYVSGTGGSPSYGTQYTLQVDFPGQASIQATSAAPSPVVISDYSIEYRPPEFDIIPVSRYQLKIVFSDMPGINFYRIGVYRRVRNQYASDETDPDSVYRTISFDGLTPGWSCGYFTDIADPIDPGGGSGLSCGEFVVTDRLFDGKDYSWSGTTLNVSDEIGKKELRLIISSLSEDYYKYFQSLERNVFHDPLIEEPFPMHSNVNGGLGVFAGYTNTNLILPMPSNN